MYVSMEYINKHMFILGKVPLYSELYINLGARLILYLSKTQEMTEHKGNQ